MTTIPDSISATLTAQWTAAGGALPTIFVTEDHVYSNPPPGGLDYIWIPAKSLLYNPKRMNDKYKNRTYTLELVANSATTADRLKEISDEIERVLDLYPITGVTSQDVTNRQIMTPARMNRPMEQTTVTMVSLLTTSTSGYGANTSANYLNSLLMYGSANAAWVNCTFDFESVDASILGTGYGIKNTGALDPLITYQCPLPPLKGSLKLYVSGVRVGLYNADAGDYVNQIIIRGNTFNSVNTINNDLTDYNSPQRIEQLFAAVDCSGYDNVLVGIILFASQAGDLEINYVTLRCYYA